MMSAILSLSHGFSPAGDASKANINFRTKATIEAWLWMQQLSQWVHQREQMWWHGSRATKFQKEKATKKKRHETAASLVKPQSEQISRRERTLCHAPVSVHQSKIMQAELLSLSLPLLSCKHCLFLIFQFLGLHDNNIIPCRKHWSGSEGNTKASVHKASQCSQCTLLHKQTTSSAQQLRSSFFDTACHPFTPRLLLWFCLFFSSPFFVSLCFNKWRFLWNKGVTKEKKRAHQPSRSSEGWKGFDAEHNDVRGGGGWGGRENEETQRE